MPQQGRKAQAGSGSHPEMPSEPSQQDGAQHCRSRWALAAASLAQAAAERQGPGTALSWEERCGSPLRCDGSSPLMGFRVEGAGALRRASVSLGRQAVMRHLGLRGLESLGRGGVWPTVSARVWVGGQGNISLCGRCLGSSRPVVPLAATGASSLHHTPPACPAAGSCFPARYKYPSMKSAGLEERKLPSPSAA